MYGRRKVSDWTAFQRRINIHNNNNLGLRMSAFHGNFFVRSTDLLAMPAVPQDLSYAIEVQIEDTITAPFVVFQTAVLHTTCYGIYIVYRSGYDF